MTSIPRTTTAKILHFPRRATCHLCHGVLVPERPWHTLHRECWHWLRATRFVLGGRREFQALARLREQGP